MSIRTHNMATSRQILQSIRSHLEIRGTVLSRIHDHGGGESDTERVITDYRAYKYTRFLFLLGFLGLFILLAGIDLGVGSYSVSVREVYAALIDHIYSAITGGTLGWCDDLIPSFGISVCPASWRPSSWASDWRSRVPPCRAC